MSAPTELESQQDKLHRALVFVAELRAVARRLRQANLSAYGYRVDQVATEIRESVESSSKAKP